MSVSIEQKRIAFLKEHLLNLSQDSRLTWAQYGIKYEHSKDGVRKWWRNFLDIYRKDKKWFTGFPIEQEWLSKLDEFELSLQESKVALPNAIGEANIDEKWVENIEQKLAYFENISDKPIRSVEEAMTLVGADKDKIIKAYKNNSEFNKENSKLDLYGGGKASENIINELKAYN